MGVLLRLDDSADEFNARDIPLAEYASRHWVDHARFEKVLPNIQFAMELFFDVDKPHYAAWCRVYDVDIGWPYFDFGWGRSEAGPSPLYIAAQLGFYDLAAHLIAKHPEQVDATGGRNRTPLVAALYGKQFHIAELLHRNGANVNVRGHFKRTPLHGASRDRLVDVVRWLLSRDADASARDTENWTPLHIAACNEDLQIFRMLLVHNSNLNMETTQGIYPLHLAASSPDHRDHLTIIQLLLDHGADPNARDFDGSTPLHCSSWREKEGYLPCRGTVEGTRLLLKHGANIDAVDDDGRTPLQIALVHGRQEMAAVLLKHGAMR
jgi:ankyrin